MLTIKSKPFKVAVTSQTSVILNADQYNCRYMNNSKTVYIYIITLRKKYISLIAYFTIKCHTAKLHFAMCAANDWKLRCLKKLAN